MTDRSARVPDRAVRVWDLPLRLFHWLLVIAIAVAFLSAEEESALNDFHVLSGWVAAVLIAFRLAWGFVGGEHARFANFVRPGAILGHVRELLRGRPAPTLGHNALGAVSVILLLLLIVATVWTGAAIGQTGEEMHELVGWSLLGLVALHILAVVLMSFLNRENLVAAMIHGRKAQHLHPGARDARPAGLLALFLAALVIAGAVLAIQSYDPAAFTLRSAESYEHGGAEAGEAKGGQGDGLEESHGE